MDTQSNPWKLDPFFPHQVRAILTAATAKFPAADSIHVDLYYAGQEMAQITWETRIQVIDYGNSGSRVSEWNIASRAAGSIPSDVSYLHVAPQNPYLAASVHQHTIGLRCPKGGCPMQSFEANGEPIYPEAQAQPQAWVDPEGMRYAMTPDEYTVLKGKAEAYDKASELSENVRMTPAMMELIKQYVAETIADTNFRAVRRNVQTPMGYSPQPGSAQASRRQPNPVDQEG